MSTFEFDRFRFYFRAIGAVHFPAGKSANTLRGAFGMLLRETAPPDVYLRLFEPAASMSCSPSGLADWPRPYLFRSSHLDGLTVAPAGSFHFDLHVFDLREPVLEYFRAAFRRFSDTGLGPGRGRASLENEQQLDLDGYPTTAHCRLDFEPGRTPVNFVRLRFLTPTELKGGGIIVDRPEFPILIARLRDRISTLRALYGSGPLEIDFREMGERASARLERCDLVHHERTRRSQRSGQTHAVGGFTGTADYTGDLTEFVPWLRAARWVGVGRHTTWGNGDVRVVIPREEPEPDRLASPAAPESSLP